MCRPPQPQRKTLRARLDSDSGLRARIATSTAGFSALPQPSQRRPASVDSAGVAGLLDLLRAKGLWLASVRYGYLFGGLTDAGNLSGHPLAAASVLRYKLGCSHMYPGGHPRL